MIQGEAALLLPTLPQAEVIYLDPMFPERKKSALVKKDMQLLKLLLGDTPDHPALPRPLWRLPRKSSGRYPKIAPFLDGIEPNYQLVGKANRFDTYLIN